MNFEESTEKHEGILSGAIHKTEELGKSLKADVGKLSKYSKAYGVGMKEEAKDLQKILDSNQLIFYKTEAMAIVLRKLGGLYDFLDACDGLTKEGYTMVNSEDVQNLPLTLGKFPIGSFYYFQHKKYIY